MELTTDVKQALIIAEIERWEQGKYLIDVRIRVAKAVGDTPEQLDALRRELERHIIALDTLNKLLDELRQSSTAGGGR